MNQSDWKCACIPGAYTWLQLQHLASWLLLIIYIDVFTSGLVLLSHPALSFILAERAGQGEVGGVSSGPAFKSQQPNILNGCGRW